MREPEFSDMSMGLWGPIATPVVRRVEGAVEALPDEDEVFEMIGELSELLGPGRCAVAYPIDSPEDLPEHWEGELVDARALIRRLLRHAGEDDRSFPVRLSDTRYAEEEGFADHLSGDLVYTGLGGQDHDQANFEVLELGDFRAMLGPICVEVGRALIHRARVRARPANYRGDERSRATSEALPSALEGFLACYTLGWGILVTNACLDPRSVGLMNREWGSLAWVAASLNYPPEFAARLLAAIYRAGERHEAWTTACQRALNPSQRGLFDEARAEFEGEEEQLRACFRWGAPESWPAQAGAALDELEFDAHDRELEAMQERHALRLRYPNLDQPVFRARPRRIWFGTGIGMVMGLVTGGALAPTLGAGFGLFVIAGLVVGYLSGRKLRRSICSGPKCGVPLEADAETCPACGGRIAGVIDNAREHLAALEALEERELGVLPEADDPL